MVLSEIKIEHINQSVCYVVDNVEFSELESGYSDPLKELIDTISRLVRAGKSLLDLLVDFKHVLMAAARVIRYAVFKLFVSTKEPCIEICQAIIIVYFLESLFAFDKPQMSCN